MKIVTRMKRGKTASTSPFPNEEIVTNMKCPPRQTPLVNSRRQTFMPDGCPPICNLHLLPITISPFHPSPSYPLCPQGPPTTTPPWPSICSSWPASIPGGPYRLPYLLPNYPKCLAAGAAPILVPTLCYPPCSVTIPLLTFPQCSPACPVSSPPLHPCQLAPLRRPPSRKSLR